MPTIEQTALTLGAMPIGERQSATTILREVDGANLVRQACGCVVVTRPDGLLVKRITHCMRHGRSAS